MAAKNTIMGKLNGKRVQLEREAQSNKDQAKYHEDQAIVYKGAAELSLKQKDAVDQAFDILTKAGVEF